MDVMLFVLSSAPPSSARLTFSIRCVGRNPPAPAQLGDDTLLVELACEVQLPDDASPVEPGAVLRAGDLHQPVPTAGEGTHKVEGETPTR